MRYIKLPVLLFVFACLLFSQQKSVFFESKSFELILDKMNFPEGPAFDGVKTLYVSSCYGGFIKKIEGNKSDFFVKADSDGINQTNGLVFSKDGYLYACDFGLGAIIKISKKKKVMIVASGYEGVKFNRPNDLAFDKNGNLYFSDPKTIDTLNPDGRLFMVNLKTGVVKLLLDKIAYPNGLAFSEDGKILYLSESARSRVLKYDVNKNGELTNERVFIDFKSGSPDGLALDVKDNLYVALFGGGVLYVVSPEGKILEEYPTPGKKPSNIEFGGSDFKTLYLTEDETNSVYKIKTKVKGLPLFNSPARKK